MRRENLTSSDYDRIPRFQFQEETTSVIAERSSTGFLLLLLPTMLIGILGFIRLSRFSLIN
jgi:hypothetical protein